MNARAISKEVILNLIMQYKEHENLYIENHPDFKSEEKRKQSIRAIYDRLSSLKPKLKFTVQQIEDKITNLRNRYKQEADLIEKAKSQGVVYSPTLWCFEELGFLSKQYRENRMKEIQNDQPPDVYFNDAKEERKRSQVNVKFLESSSGFLRESHLKHALVENSVFALGRHAESLQFEREERKKIKNFGNFVAAEMQKISDPAIRMEAKWDIQVALRKGIERDMLTQT